jgi:hypothetical protein
MTNMSAKINFYTSTITSIQPLEMPHNNWNSSDASNIIH